MLLAFINAWIDDYACNLDETLPEDVRYKICLDLLSGHVADNDFSYTDEEEVLLKQTLNYLYGLSMGACNRVDIHGAIVNTLEKYEDLEDCLGEIYLSDDYSEAEKKELLTKAHLFAVCSSTLREGSVYGVLSGIALMESEPEFSLNDLEDDSEPLLATVGFDEFAASVKLWFRVVLLNFNIVTYRKAPA